MNQMNQLPDDDLLALLMADEAGSEQSIARIAEQGPSAVSFAQQRLWFLQQLAPQSSAYNLPRALQLRGALSAEVLEKALQTVVDRHDILRTAFVEIDGQPLQIVDPQAQLILHREDLSALEPDLREKTLRTRLSKEAGQAFDLSQAPLIRTTLIKSADNEHVLLLNMHHIVSDAWSNPILMNDLAAAYALASAGSTASLPRPAIQYHDYARWQREEYPLTAQHDAAAEYWKTYLGSEITPLALPVDFTPAPDALHTAASHDLTLPAELVRQLNSFCHAQGLTPFVVLLGTWQLLLGRYSGQQDFTVGVPNATRTLSETQELVGYFVSSLIYRAQLDPAMSTSDFLQRLREQSLFALEHADYPIELIIEELQLQRSAQANPLFQTLFNWRVGSQEQGSMTLGNLALDSLLIGQQEAKFDLALDVEYQQNAIQASLEYSAAVFSTDTIERMAGHLQNLLRAIVADPTQRIADLPLLTAAEQQLIVRDWNDTKAAYPLERPVHHLIEEQVMLTPDASALVFGDFRLSYQQLNQRANQLAHQLIVLGVGPDVLVGIAVERSVEMVVGLLAVLKAGGAYVPLDPEYPQDRLSYMIEDSGIGLLLTQDHLLSQLPIPEALPRLALDQLDLSAYSTVNPAISVHPENLAYVIYTSGSTGKPKGAGNRHSALTNRLCWMQEAYGLNTGDTVLQKTPFSFDVSVWEFFWPLMTGARLAVAGPGDHRDPAKLVELINQHQVTTLHFVPSMLQVFLLDENVTRCTGLKRIVCSGEALQVDTQQQVFAKLPQAGLFNLYGPTEAAIDVTHWTCREEGKDAVPIGQPIANLTTYILDGTLEPVPVGVIGELYLGGEGLARGYHRRPALTAERFMTSPFGDGERLYRTGDLACYRADGVIEYRGRIDHQVKIRGLRIELGEIEARLMEQDAVREAVVLAVDGPSGQQLVGYVVPTQAGDEESLRESIKTKLKQNLPDYMVPTHLLFLEQLPLSPNGKLERKALPKLDGVQQQKIYVAPQTELQQQIAAIWQDVLKLEQVGLHDDFFELGGHSLLATQVISRLRQALNLDVALRTLFEHSQLHDFAASLGQKTVGNEPPFLRVNRDQPLALSYAQERQLFLWQFYPQSSAYHIPAAIRMRGNLDVTALERSLNALIARHESLRTTFIQSGEQSFQVIAPEVSLSLSANELPAHEQTAEQLQALIEAETARPFDLQQGPLLRAKLLKLTDDEHILILTQHHIVSDGWSTQVMIEELVECYGAYSEGREATLPSLPIQYADYAVWQRQWMDAGERQRQLAYWVEQLGTEQTTLALPTDRARPAEQSFCGAKVDISLHVALSQALQALAHREGVTTFMILLASFQVLLHRYSGQNDIRVGTPIANRTRMETERLIGFFVNTLVLKADINGQMHFTELLQQVKHTALEAQAHQDLPFEQLVEALQPERSLSQSPLFQVLFNHHSENTRPQPAQRLPKLTLESLDADTHSAKFDLAVDTFEGAEGLSAVMTYATDLFDPVTAERMAIHWQNLLQAIVSDPTQYIGDLALLTADEQQMIVRDWNDTKVTYPLERPVHHLIEEQVMLTPDASALVFGDFRLSYQQLNQRANQLAHQLIVLGVGPDVLVGIAVERSVEMVVGLLAVLKAGGAYVPLDPEYPQDRLNYMIEDSGIGLLLTQHHLLSQLPIPEALPRLALDQLDLSAYSTVNLAISVHPENLAYVIYTSGSTGKPKGAGNRHSALTNRLCWMQEAYGLNGSDTVLQKTPFSFDVSVWEFFWPLMTGARLAVAGPGDHRDPAKLIELINLHDVTTLHFVPSMLQVFLLDENVASCTGLKRIVCSGEALQVDTQQQVFAKLPQAGLFNLYGPTEAAIDVTHWTCREEGKDAVPIGQPIANLTTYILDGTLESVPVGVIGELYLGGEGLARGYHRRPALTAERFMTSPFGDGERLYRTGDLACYRTDGVIEYRGRIDHQVKIRGLRIELGEIEARLMEQDAVREAVVLAVDGPSGQQLVGYVVPTQAGDEERLRESIKTKLKQNLPDYMVPTHLLFLEQLPLSPNGKLDRKVLPQPDTSLLQQAYVAPQSELEQRIAAIWQDVLKLEQVGLTDNFFELGGDSIISIQVVSRARQAGIRFTPKELFQHQTVQGLASVAQTGDGANVVDQAPVTGNTPLLPIHQVFFEDNIPERHHWNQSVLLKPASALNPDLLEKALAALIDHHDALRLNFTQGGEGWSANFAGLSTDSVLWRSEIADIAELEQLGDEAQRSLNLQQGPLLRAVLANLPDGEQRLLLAIHHLAVDGVSWRILFEDLQTAYRQLLANQAVQLPLKTSSVKAWTEKLQRYACSEALQNELHIWSQQLQDVSTNLPSQGAQPEIQNKYAVTVHTHLNKSVTRQLLQEAPAAYRTQINDLLLTALANVITRWTGQRSVLVQLEGHGREDIFDNIDLTRTVGWFTSMFPVKLTPAEHMGDSIKQIKEQLRAIPNKGIGFGALRYLGDEATQRSLAALPVPRITFNYLGQFDGSFDENNVLFTPAPENAGSQQNSEAPLGNWISLNGQVYNGELTLGWTFSHKMFDVPVLQALADEYAEELSQLICHCSQAENNGVTPSDFPLARLTQTQLDALPVQAKKIDELYPLSPMQQGMLFHSLYNGDSGDYITQMNLEVEGLDAERFRVAWQSAMDAHDILRTGFFWKGELPHPVQAVFKSIQIPFTIHDWCDRPDLKHCIARLADAERKHGFDLSSTPLLRLHVIQIDDNRHHLIFTSHHILMDGWSTSQLLGDVLQRYSGQTVLSQPSRYQDYIGWLEAQDKSVSEVFWKEQLAALHEPTLLKQALTDTTNDHGYDHHYLELGIEYTQRLNEFARHQKVTLNTVFQAAWMLLLQRYTGQATVTFGATVAGRPAELKGSEQLIGLFINTLPVIGSPRPEQSISDWLHTVQNQNLGVREHEHTPLFDLQRWAGKSGEALFDNILVFENYPVSETLQQGAPQDLKFGEIKHYEQTNYPLTLSVGVGQVLTLHLSFDLAAFSAKTIKQITGHLYNLLNEMLESPDLSLSNLSMTSMGERTSTLAHWNPRSARYTSDQSIHVLIETQAVRTPQAIALTRGEHQVSYETLNKHANQVAHRLIAQGVGPDVLVGLAAERSIEMIIGLLAILKAGGAYVPLDPAYPEDRLAYMIEDSGLKMLLTQEHLIAQLPIPATVYTLSLNAEQFSSYSDANPNVVVDPANLAYVIYTSGSTGKPKGALLAHHNVLRLFQATQDWFQFGPQDVWSLFHSYAFDFSVWEIFGALLYGGRLVIVPQEVSRSPEAFYALLCNEGVTVLNQTPSAFRALMPVALAAPQSNALRYVVFGGEALDVPGLRPWFERFGDQAPQLINMYGITETTVHVTYRPITLADLDADASSPIGQPIPDLSWYLLDADLNPVPKGCVGELYVGQAGLARGYLKRADLSATRFVPDPFGDSGERLYRTGDLARYRTDGVIEYVGRIDHQVKIRGFRIELGEIEAQLQLQPQVREAVVLAVEGPGGQQLVAYVIARQAVDDQAALRDVLKAQLRATLPDYMVPAHVLFLEYWPLTANGKLDRKALPKADASQIQQAYLAPQSELEHQVAAIWQQVLGLEKVGLNDEFFELGGHSLLVIRVVSRIQLDLGLQLSPQQLFQFPVLSDFVSNLQQSGGQFDNEKLSKLEALLDDMEEV